MSSNRKTRRRRSNLLLPAAALAGLLLLRRADAFDKLAGIFGAGAGGEGGEPVDDGLLQPARPQLVLDPELYGLEQPAEAAPEATPEAPAPAPAPSSGITSPSRQLPAPAPAPTPPPTPPSRDVSLRRELASGAAFAAGAIAAERAAKAVSRRIRARAKAPGERAESRVRVQDVPTPKATPRARVELREKAPATRVERLSVRRLARRVREVLKPSRVSRIVQTSLREFPKGAETAFVVLRAERIPKTVPKPIRKLLKLLPSGRKWRIFGGGAV